MKSDLQLHKHRVTVLPDGVEVSDEHPVAKRSKACYNSVSPCHIPKIGVCMALYEDSEQLAIKIPTTVFEQIPMLNDFQQVLVNGESSRGAGVTMSATALAMASPTGDTPLLTSDCKTS